MKNTPGRTTTLERLGYAEMRGVEQLIDAALNFDPQLIGPRKWTAQCFYTMAGTQFLADHRCWPSTGYGYESAAITQKAISWTEAALENAEDDKLEHFARLAELYAMLSLYADTRTFIGRLLELRSKALLHGDLSRAILSTACSSDSELRDLLAYAKGDPPWTPQRLQSAWEGGDRTTIVTPDHSEIMSVWVRERDASFQFALDSPCRPGVIEVLPANFGKEARAQWETKSQLPLRSIRRGGFPTPADDEKSSGGASTGLLSIGEVLAAIDQRFWVVARAVVQRFPKRQSKSDEPSNK